MPKKQHTWTKKGSDRQMENFSRHLLVRRGLAPYTIEGYRRVMAKVLKDMKTLRPTHRRIENYVAKTLYGNGYSYNHIVNTCLAIERYMEYLKNPIRLGRPRKPKRMITGTLSEAEIAVILDACKNIRERAILALAAYSGIRSRELCGLRVKDLDPGNSVVRIFNGKNARDRAVCIPGECVNILLDYLREFPRGPEDYLFTTLVNGNQYGPQDLRKLLLTVTGRTHIQKRVYPHLLRHSLATNLIARGANLLTVKEQLGHAWIDTTMVYVTSRFQRIMVEYQNFAPSYL